MRVTLPACRSSHTPLVTVLAILATLLVSGPAAAAPAPCTLGLLDAGTSPGPANPYLVTSVDDLAQVGRLTIDGMSATEVACPLDGHYLQTADITLPPVADGEVNHTPIGLGVLVGGGPSWPFVGTYDGGGHAIVGLRADSVPGSPPNESRSDAALFRATGPTAIIRNLGVLDARVQGSRRIAALAATMDGGTVDNVRVEATLIGPASQLGGVVADAAGLPSVSDVDVTVTIVLGDEDAKVSAGGVLGNGTADIARARADVRIMGAVTDFFVGGLAGGHWGGVIADSVATGEIDITDVAGWVYLGGLVGGSTGTIRDSYANVAVTARAGTWAVGGLIGGGSATVTRTYAAGRVDVTALTDPTAGGLIGEDWGADVTGSFWDTTVSGLGVAATGSGLTTTQLRARATFLDAGWAIVDGWEAPSERAVWGICEAQTTPFLLWEYDAATAPVCSPASNGGGSSPTVPALPVTGPVTGGDGQLPRPETGSG